MGFKPLQMLQWSHDLAVVETLTSHTACALMRRFNGATTLRSWKPPNDFAPVST